MTRSIRRWMAGFALVLAAGAALAQAAQPADAASVPAATAIEPRADDTNAQRQKSQPYNNAPFWRAVRESGNQAGYTSLPGAEKGVLIQPFVQYPGSRFTTAGEAWREVRNRWIIPYGGALIVIMLVAIGLFYKAKGSLALHAPETGRKIERFTYFERAAHWTNAIAFSLLAISGLVMAFGKFLLLPILGGTLFGWLTYALKNIHNFAGPVFAVSLAVVFLTFVRDNLPSKDDIQWLLRFGGLFSGREVPSRRFNAGEKVVFWGGVFLLGFTVVGSGLVLDRLIPGYGVTRGEMQIAHMVHAVATILMMTMFLGHIYLGTIGMQGAYRAMRTGYVDETWAKEHHELWYDDIRAGKIPAQRSKPEGAPVQPATSA
ncbi:formate dehydrogenase subunit gamma [Caldimonas sp. KR1-144]|uniref:formate dehydrogenase subunit gamma n=1 Tax=Caldimonas sp. KR1-144 TaxID=3400911 RepID=UPI003C0A3865